LTKQAAENRPAKLKRVRENRMASIKRKIHRSKKRLSFTNLVSTEPGSLAGRYMRRFWHPVHRAEDLMPGQAKPIQIMSERFTLYRGEGGAPRVLEVLSTMEWPCNFFQRMDNNGDTAHVPFVHRGAYSSSSANRRSGIPQIAKEESLWGTTSYATFPAGWTNVFHLFMPNAYAFR